MPQLAVAQCPGVVEDAMGTVPCFEDKAPGQRALQMVELAWRPSTAAEGHRGPYFVHEDTAGQIPEVHIAPGLRAVIVLRAPREVAEEGRIHQLLLAHDDNAGHVARRLPAVDRKE